MYRIEENREDELHRADGTHCEPQFIRRRHRGNCTASAAVCAHTTTDLGCIVIKYMRSGIPAIHPGERLAEELEALNMSAAELARKLRVPTNRVTQILNGRRSITGDTALRLAHFFGTSAQFWLNLQSLYELRVAIDKSGKSIERLPTLKRSSPVHA